MFFYNSAASSSAANQQSRAAPPAAASPLTSVDLERQLQEWQLRRQLDLLRTFSPHRRVIMNTYHAILLAGRPALALPLLALYCMLLKFVSQSALFMMASVVVLRALAPIDYTALRFVGGLVGRYEKWIDIDRALVAAKTSIPPLEFEELCTIVSQLETKWHSWRIHMHFMRKSSSFMFLFTVLFLYALAGIATSLFDDSTILFGIGAMIPLIPAIYHYDVPQLFVNLFNAVGRAMTTGHLSEPEPSANQLRQAPLLSTKIGDKLKGWYDEYQKYLSIPDEFQPRDISSGPVPVAPTTNLAGGTTAYYTAYNNAFQFLASTSSFIYPTLAPSAPPLSSARPVSYVEETIIPSTSSPPSSYSIPVAASSSAIANNQDLRLRSGNIAASTTSNSSGESIPDDYGFEHIQGPNKDD